MIIGLDGVPLNIIQRWTQEGYLPTLRQLMAGGTVGQLKSSIPPTSGPSWSSFMTGMNPGKTGIYDFLYRREGTYSFPPVNASQRSGTTMWRYLSDAGYRVGVLNLPMSYPVEKINGFMVSGWMTPYNATDYVHPPDLAAELSHLSHRDLYRRPPGGVSESHLRSVGDAHPDRRIPGGQQTLGRVHDSLFRH